MPGRLSRTGRPPGNSEPATIGIPHALAYRMPRQPPPSVTPAAKERESSIMCGRELKEESVEAFELVNGHSDVWRLFYGGDLFPRIVDALAAPFSESRIKSGWHRSPRVHPGSGGGCPDGRGLRGNSQAK